MKKLFEVKNDETANEIKSITMQNVEDANVTEIDIMNLVDTYIDEPYELEPKDIKVGMALDNMYFVFLRSAIIEFNIKILQGAMTLAYSNQADWKFVTNNFSCLVRFEDLSDDELFDNVLILGKSSDSYWLFGIERNEDSHLISRIDLNTFESDEVAVAYFKKFMQNSTYFSGITQFKDGDTILIS